MQFGSCLQRFLAIVESVKRATYGGVLSPRIRSAVVSVCRKFGKFAAEALDLGGDVASVKQKRDEFIDAAFNPFRPFVFDQGGGIGEMGALEVRQVEFTNDGEDPTGGELSLT